MKLKLFYFIFFCPIEKLSRKWIVFWELSLFCCCDIYRFSLSFHLSLAENILCELYSKSSFIYKSVQNVSSLFVPEQYPLAYASENSLAIFYTKRKQTRQKIIFKFPFCMKFAIFLLLIKFDIIFFFDWCIEFLYTIEYDNLIW